MKMKISAYHIRNLFSCKVSGPQSTNLSTSIDIREEYANAFRTESYVEFWTHVLALTHGESATCTPVETTTAARLSSYRLFAEHLLDPDQPTVTKILSLTQIQNHPDNHSLLSDYFSKTADASLLCGLLLKDIDQTRVQYRLLKTALDSLQTSQLPTKNYFSAIFERLAEFSNFLNPFSSLASSPNRFRVVQDRCNGLLELLELSCNKAQSQLPLFNSFKRGSAIFLVALTASVVAIVVTHAVATLVVVPGFITASLRLASTKKLDRVSAQLNAAAKGTYILNRDLDTISRLVTRLHDELEHVRTMVRFWLKRWEDSLQPSQEVARQLMKNDSSFSQQLDELEEHLYLCFMTINRARSLVIKEVLGLSRA